MPVLPPTPSDFTATVKSGAVVNSTVGGTSVRRSRNSASSDSVSTLRAIVTQSAIARETISLRFAPTSSAASAPRNPPTPPAGVGASLLAFARTLATTFAGFDTVPTNGGSLTINSQSVGNYEVTTRGADTRISSFTALDWFTSVKDTRSSWIVVNGNLTIDAGQILTPPVRKLFTVLYVTGNLICNGGISMTARGANHSGTGDSGGATPSATIRIGTGTFSGVSNPQIPSLGGSPGTGRTTNGQNAAPSGSNGQTGGGGGGYWFSSGGFSGNGSDGSSFSGGTGGGAQYGNSGSATSGSSNGGAGGDSGGGQSAGGGAGNPGGTGTGGFNGGNGTGGTLIVIVGGTLSGSGTISADGVAGGSGAGVLGGGSGGGSVTVLFGTDSSSITPTATGGSGGGGNGTARKLAIGAN